MFKSILLIVAGILFLLVTPIQLLAQQQGCTDPQAINYQSNAIVNDGSCQYNLTLYKPEIRFLLPKEVDETSGLVFWRNSLWTHNDSGGLPILYRLDTLDGTVKQKITIGGVDNVDWEELADDSLYIYVGDFGNNAGHRHDLVIYKVNKSDIPLQGDTTVTAEKIYFTYPDYPDNIAGRSQNNYDCEAMVSVGDSLYLFSKDWQDSRTRMYRLPKTAGTYTAGLIAGFNSAGLITAADYNKKNNQMVLLGYTNGSWIPFMWLFFDFQEHRFFSGNKRRIDMPKVTATQTEGLVFSRGDEGFISSESNPLFMPTMYHFDIGTWTQTGPTAVKTTTAAGIDFSLSPNPIQKGKLTVHLQQVPVNAYRLELYDSSGKQVLTTHFKVSRKKRKTAIRLPVEALKPGVYFVRLRSGNFMVERKFIKE